jgi:hypothetical protein
MRWNFITMNNHLTLFREIIAIYSEIHMECIITPCEENGEFWMYSLVVKTVSINAAVNLYKVQENRMGNIKFY